jgi:2-C-methyl-D-erythritol 4-phosphate cytidylyltransferase
MIYAIIVAGGIGTRMNSTVPKQFLEVNGKPVILYSIEKFIQSYPSIEIIIVLPNDYIDMCSNLLKSYNIKQHIHFVTGGDTRFQSVKNGLDVIHNDGIVFVHDAVRPCINKELLDRLYIQAIKTGNAIPCVELKDSIRFVEKGISKSVDRQCYKSIQTPQTFNIETIKKAFLQEFQSTFTDEASVLESIGGTINLVDGLDENVKVTRPADLELVSILLKKYNEST